MNGIDREKQALRREFKLRRASLGAAEKLSMDSAITESFLKLDLYRQSGTLLIYYSTDIEVDTHAVVEAALADGKRVALPVCGKDSRMDFFEIKSTAELAAADFGIFAPPAEESRLVYPSDGALCVVPGLSFDSSGFRLGFGKGFYDRYISRTGVKALGLCYESFVCDRLPQDIYDKRVNALLTDINYRKFIL